MQSCDVSSCNIIRTMLNSSMMPSFLLEKDGTIITLNDKALPYVRAKSQMDVIGKKLETLIDDVLYEELRKVMLEAIFRGKFVTFNYYCKESKKTYEILCTPIHDENLGFSDNIDFIFLHIFDIDMMKVINPPQEDSNDILKSTFLSNISHELKTPMNTIIGFSDLLLLPQYKDNISRDRFIKAINTNAKHLEELLNNILDYAKIEAGQLDFLYENFEIGDIFCDLKLLFEDINLQKNQKSVKLIFKDQNTKIVSDQFRIKQVLHNLLSNAIKFTDNGTIEVGCTPDFENATIKFYVKDTGIGIPDNRIDLIFDRFVQIDSSPTKKNKGTGLGLSIAKNIVELLGGTIWVDSVFGKGSTFYFRIPLEEIQDDITLKTKHVDESITYDNKVILLVDGIPDNYSLLSIMLKSKGIRCIYVDDGEEAINIYRKEKKIIDAVFLDINLATINGFEVAEKIKQINKKATIISISEIDVKDSRFIDYYMSKPYTRGKLLDILKQIFTNG